MIQAAAPKGTTRDRAEAAGGAGWVRRMSGVSSLWLCTGCDLPTDFHYSNVVMCKKQALNNEELYHAMKKENILLFVTCNALPCCDVPPRSRFQEASPGSLPEARRYVQAADPSSAAGLLPGHKNLQSISFVSTPRSCRESCILINITIVRNRPLQRALQA